MIRVVLADDHPVVRAGLRAILDRYGDDMTVVGEAATGEEALALCAARQVDLVLMDLRFAREMSGVEATGAIRAAHPDTTVLVVTNYDTDTEILRAIEAGASGYLLKDSDPQDLLSAMRAAAGGETALSPAVAGRLFARLHKPEPTLTAQETAVLAEVARGASNREVARALFISEGTVKGHLTGIFDKLGVRTRTAAVAVAERRGLLEPGTRP